MYWLGTGPHAFWAHVFCGTMEEDGRITGIWGDLPLGRDHMHGTLELRFAADGATPVDFNVERFNAQFMNAEMEKFQLEAAATRIQAQSKGRADRKKVAPLRDAAEAEKKEMTAAATKIQARHRGAARRKEMIEEAEAATVVQSRFRGHAQRKEAEQMQQSATAIQARFRGHQARKAPAES